MECVYGPRRGLRWQMTIAGARRITAQFVQPNRNNTVSLHIAVRHSIGSNLKIIHCPRTIYRMHAKSPHSMADRSTVLGPTSAHRAQAPFEPAHIVSAETSQAHGVGPAHGCMFDVKLLLPLRPGTIVIITRHLHTFLRRDPGANSHHIVGQILPFRIPWVDHVVPAGARL